jgi:DNA-binding GntR family transcriptional regulator
VREALRQLEVQGLVTRRPGRGVVVTASKPESAREFLELLRLAEPLALRLAFPHLGKETLRRARQLAYEHARNRDPARAAELNQRFHTTLYAPAGRPLLLSLIRAFYDFSYLFAHAFVTQRPADFARVHPIHHRLLDACAAGDLEGALAALEEDLHLCARSVEAILEEDRGLAG